MVANYRSHTKFTHTQVSPTTFIMGGNWNIHTEDKEEG